MRTIYIKGNGQYKKSIRKALFKSELKEGEDFIVGYASPDYVLIWIAQDLLVRELKLAITAKYIWKHRMQFFTTIEGMNPPKKEEPMSTFEREMLNMKFKKGFNKEYRKFLKEELGHE